MNIRCRKFNCKFNQGGTCEANDVCVGRQAVCNTFQQDHDKQNLELAAELTPTTPNNVPLHCQAQNCLYNHHCRCVANGITVIDNDAKKCADCATYIER